MTNFNRIRRIIKALPGAVLQPSSGDAILSAMSAGNPYMMADGMARLKAPILKISLNRSTWLDSMLNKGGEFIKNNPQLVGLGIDFLDKTFLLSDYTGKYGSTLLGLDSAFDFTSNALGWTPYGWAMKGAGFVSDGLKKLGIMGTDNTNTVDSVLGSKFFSLTPTGLINNTFTKKTKSLSVDTKAVENVIGGYGGFQKDWNRAQEVENKKVGSIAALTGALGRNNNLITDVNTKGRAIANIGKEASDIQSIGSNMSDINHINYWNSINGDFDTRYYKSAKFGGKLLRIKKINFHKKGGEIKGAIDLNEKVTDEDRIQILEDIIKVGEEEKIIDKDQELPKWIPKIFEFIDRFEEGGNIEWKPEILLEGGDIEEKWDFDTWFNSIPEKNRANQYDYKLAFEVLDEKDLKDHAKDPENNHLKSVSNKLDDKGRYPFLKLGKLEDNPELQGEFDWYNGKASEYSLEDLDFRNNHTIEYDGDRYYYIPKKFKDGGKTEETELPKVEETTLKNVIPEGALHAHKHHMENAENLTKKGIPVVDNDSELLAEIERDELILTLELTKTMEDLYKQFYSDESSLSKKDEVAIEAGKILVHEILFNTDDRTGLLSKLEQGGVINGTK